MYLEGVPGGEVAQPKEKLDGPAEAVTHVRSVLGGRALSRLTPDIQDFLAENHVFQVYLAGGALMRGTPADLDFFPVPGYGKNFEEMAAGLVSKPEAQLGQITIAGIKLQFCRAMGEEVKPLYELVDSFDFAHCKAGAHLVRTGSGWHCMEVYVAPDFIAAMCLEGTHYTGEKWPLRSLARVPKVVAKLGLDVADARELTHQVMKSIVGRGFDAVLAEDQSFADLVQKKCPFDGLDRQTLSPAEVPYQRLDAPLWWTP